MRALGAKNSPRRAPSLVPAVPLAAPTREPSEREAAGLGAALPVREDAIFGSSSEANLRAVPELPAPLPTILMPSAAALRSAACFALKAL